MVGVTKAATMTLGIRSLLADFGVKCTARVWTDSSAAVGMCSRQGLGKVRHLDVQTMWVQQRVRNNDLDLHYVPGDKNPADIFTKPNIPHERMESLLRSMGCAFTAGRPKSAPTLRTEGGTKVLMLKHRRRWSDEEEQLEREEEQENQERREFLKNLILAPFEIPLSTPNKYFLSLEE